MPMLEFVMKLYEGRKRKPHKPVVDVKEKGA